MRGKLADSGGQYGADFNHPILGRNGLFDRRFGGWRGAGYCPARSARARLSGYGAGRGGLCRSICRGIYRGGAGDLN